MLTSLKFDEKLNEKEQLSIPWEIEGPLGITHDPESTYHLISNGSNYLYEVELSDRPAVINTLRIYDENKRILEGLASLAWVEGLVWANLKDSSKVAIIDLKTRKAKILDFSPLRRIAGIVNRRLKKRSLKEEECLSGIAYNSQTKKILLTGKNWPIVFEIKMNLKFAKVI